MDFILGIKGRKMLNIRGVQVEGPVYRCGLRAYWFLKRGKDDYAYLLSALKPKEIGQILFRHPVSAGVVILDGCTQLSDRQKKQIAHPDTRCIRFGCQSLEALTQGCHNKILEQVLRVLNAQVTIIDLKSYS